MTVVCIRLVMREGSVARAIFMTGNDNVCVFRQVSVILKPIPGTPEWLQLAETCTHGHVSDKKYV